MDPKTPIRIYSGIAPGHNSATGFPVRSHHLSGLLEGTAVKGELPHLTNLFFYSIADAMSTRKSCDTVLIANLGRVMKHNPELGCLTRTSGSTVAHDASR